MLSAKKIVGLVGLIGLLIAGVFFLAMGYQTAGATNWFGHVCRIEAGCINPEWLAVGAGCLVGAFLFYREAAK
jgi:hypothetical protein